MFWMWVINMLFVSGTWEYVKLLQIGLSSLRRNRACTLWTFVSKASLGIPQYGELFIVTEMGALICFGLILAASCSQKSLGILKYVDSSFIKLTIISWIRNIIFNGIITVGKTLQRIYEISLEILLLSYF